MDYSNKINELTNKIYNSRLRMLSFHPFFGVFALDMKYKLDSKINNFSTDGYTISFNPNFLSVLKDNEVDTCILHCLLHTILKHPFKKNEYPEEKVYNLACDIVVNSNIIYSTNVKELYLLGQKLPHLAPDGQEGYKYSVDEVYYMLLNKKTTKPNFSKKPLLGIKSDFSGYLYSKDFSLAKYSSNGDWSNPVRRKKNYSVSPDTYLYIKLKELNEKVHTLTYSNLSELEMLPTPSYPENYPISNYDCVANKIENKTETHNFIGTIIDLPLLKKLKQTKFKDPVIEKEEMEYRKYVRKKYLDISPQLQDFFNNIISIEKFNKDDEDILFKAESYISHCAKYNIQYLPVSNGQDYIIHFMNVTKEGKCSHFASSLVMLYRALGIPARLTVGFNTISSKGKTTYAYQENYHAWTEVYVDNVGWVRMEGTPGVPYSLESDPSIDKKENNNHSDDHEDWKNNTDINKNNDRMNDLNNKLMQANEIASSKKAGSVPAFVPIMLKEFKEPQIDWRVYLNSFIQENIVDYSFCPPDTRFQDSDFILPSFSEKDEEVNNILFMVDVSGSMSVDEITSCFSEIQAAIIQFNGKLKGYIGFFDAEVKDVYEFDGDTILHDLKIGGGGGTNFQIIFDYINKNMKDELPNTLIILTDGYADFPSKKDQPSYPVLWVINNKEVTPPWGQFTRILK